MSDLRRCSVEGCGRTVRARGWCNMHWTRWRRHGSLVEQRTPTGTPLAWLTAAIAQSTDDCIDWPFSTKRHGYGQIIYEGKPSRAPRVALMLAGHQPPYEGAFALHSCDRPVCVNVRHLRWGTRQDNSDDKMARGRHVTWFANGGVRGERAPAAILTAAQVQQIRAEHARGELQRVLAARYGVGQSAISSVVLRQSWAHVA